MIISAIVRLPGNVYKISVFFLQFSAQTFFGENVGRPFPLYHLNHMPAHDTVNQRKSTLKIELESQ